LQLNRLRRRQVPIVQRRDFHNELKAQIITIEPGEKLTDAETQKRRKIFFNFCVFLCPAGADYVPK